MSESDVTAAIASLEGALARLRQVPSAADAGPPLRDGRYEGGNGELFVELRVDAGGAGVLSGDVSRTGTEGPQYVASFRTAPGTRYTGAVQAWPAAWEGAQGDAVTGTVTLTGAPVDPESAFAALRLDTRLNGLPPNVDLVVAARRVGDELRSLGLEIETEQGVQLPGAVPSGGVSMTITEALRRAGFAVHDAGVRSTVPPQAGGWNISTTLTVLHDLMAETAQAALGAPAWELHLLMLAASTRPRLLGVMFDSADVLPRQGAAIFVSEIRRLIPPPDQDRKIIQTTVHELGHALNLAHRFERPVGRADSTSFMNYDWRYGGGGKAEEFWLRFAFAFDADELEFLRHAPRNALEPGRAAFHSVNYWADGSGGYSAYVPEVPLPGFELTLAPPPVGPVFAFGQPVFLEVTLRNTTSGPLQLPPEALDPKAGFLELLIRRVTGRAGPALAEARPFVPMMQRCFDAAVSAEDALPSGESLRNNLNVTFGSGGFAFAEPGEFGITPLLAVPTRDGRQDRIVRGAELRIRVAHPHDMAEEHDALTLFRPDVGAWFALGGSDVLVAAGEALEEVKQRRSARAGADDGVVAAITRAAGIQAGRDSLRYRGGQFVASAGDPELAGELLGSLAPAALRTFDTHTAENTVELAAGYPAPKRRR